MEENIDTFLPALEVGEAFLSLEEKQNTSNKKDKA